MVFIESLASGGEGVGRLDDGRVVFVQGACPGDTVEIEVVADKKRWVVAHVHEIIDASADRVEPPCPSFGSCGGCQWQHIAYPVQLAAKRRIVSDALERIGGIEAQSLVAECVPSPQTYGYRNKIELVPVAGPRLGLGFHHLGSDVVVPIERCLLLPKAHQKAPERLAGALRYASGTQDLGVRRVGLRVSTATSDVEVALWTEPSAFPRSTVATTIAQGTHASSVVRVLSRDVRGRHNATTVEVLSGKGFWRERLDDFVFAVSAPSFFQVNTAAAKHLVARALDALAPDGSDSVLDVYAGVGTFTLPLAQRARSVTCVEGAGSAVRDLRRNLEMSQLFADVQPGEAARVVGDLGHFDAALVDPPRSGLDASVLAAVAQTRASTLVYVSCDPATLARDARLLADAGYWLTSVTPVDLFPQTHHVETVARFESTAAPRS